MPTSNTFQRPSLIVTDWMPASARRFTLFAIGLSLALRAAGYLLSSDVAAVNGSHDWIYHGFWLPLHLFLARYAATAFSRNVDACMLFSRAELRDELRRRVAAITSFKGMLASLMLVAPFVFLDSIAAVSYVRENFQTQGHAAGLIPAIWLIEWFATAQIWLYVLGSIYFNSKVLSDANILGRHEPILMSGEARSPLLCGLENALITAVYGLSTIGYVWYAQGQVSDYLVLVISTVLMLICFFSALLQLKSALRKSLDADIQDYRRNLAAQTVLKTDHLPFAAFKEAVGMVFDRRIAKEAKVEERLRGIKLAAVLAVPPGSDEMDRAMYARALLLMECETRFSEFGVAEIRSVSLRAGMPIFLILGKSAGGLIGVH